MLASYAKIIIESGCIHYVMGAMEFYDFFFFFFFVVFGAHKRRKDIVFDKIVYRS